MWNEILLYPRGVVEEAQKIDWPSLPTTFRLTVIVVVIIAVATIYVGALDAILSRVVAFVLQ